MKKMNWFRSLSLADDKYIAEAHPDNMIRPRRNRLLASLTAACVCFALLFCALWLFIPFDTEPPSVEKYSESEYHDLIQKLNVLTFEKPTYTNNADKFVAEMEGIWINGTKNEMMVDGAPTASGTGTESYEEITDNQVEGITEADRIKRSDKYIYYLDNETLRIYSIDGENTKELGSYVLYGGEDNYYVDQWEFYLSSDCKSVTVITQYYTKLDTASERFVNLVSLDVSDPANITKKEEFSITGSYMSSRVTDGIILLLTEFVIDKKVLDFEDETTFIPQIDEGDGTYSLPANCIMIPEKPNDTRYTVVMKLNCDTLKPEGSSAYLSYSKDVYVSKDHVFLTHVFEDKKENEDGSITRNAMTEISLLTYGGENFETVGSATVRGYVKDQWSMDEYDGILRVFTTTNATTFNSSYEYDTPVSVLKTATGKSNASLYCIDLATLETVASVIDFAPEREEVQSVRFDKESAYVCTSIELSDPVFFFDLSDLSNISYKDTGTIEGFSTSLINLGDGYLLGIGRGKSWDTFKVELYEETEDGVRSVCSYELENTEYSTEYKSYYIDREEQLVGIGVEEIISYSTGESRYILLHFDGYELAELVNVPLDGKPANMRGVYIDGYMYMFGAGEFKVEKVFG